MSNDVSVLDNNAQSFIRAEVDCQITTAKSYPRVVKKCIEEAKAMATLDKDIADSCIFALPVGGNVLKGPSVRLAEIMAYAWGNIQCATRIVEKDANAVVVEAVAWDLEKNVKITVPVRRQIQKSRSGQASDFMINNAVNAAISIALRNAIFRVVPKNIVNMIYEEAKKVAIGDITSLSETRDKALIWFNRAGIQTAKILNYLAINSIDEITQEHIEIFIGTSNALKDKVITPEQAFNVEGEKPTNQSLEDLNNKVLGDA